MIPEKKKEVYKFTDLAELRFKPDSLNKPAAVVKFEEVKGWTNKLLEVAKQKIFNNPSSDNVQPVSPIKISKGQVVDITLAALLNSQLLLIGNPLKLDLIQFQVNKHYQQIQVTLITQVFSDFPIKTITIQRKKQFVIFNGDRIIELYVLDSKSRTLLKKFIYNSQNKIKGIQLIGDNCLVQFHDNYLNILGLQNWQPQVIKKIFYQASTSFKVFRIPQASQNYGNIFLYDESQYNSANQSDPILIYTCQIVYENSEFKLSKVEKFYQLLKSKIENLIIYNYDINTVLLNFGTKMIVFRNHYPIDQVKIKYVDQHSKLYFLENKNILHVYNNMVESYSLQVFTDRVKVQCFDCINFVKPRYSLLLATPSLNNDKFSLILKLDNKKNSKQTRYWITSTIETSIKVKLQTIFNKAGNDNNFICQSAMKMGMSRKQIFNELWMQSNRKSKQDFDILLQSQDYKTITEGVRNVLKKESISFQELVRIQKQCLRMLENQIKIPTQNNLVQYLKCSFNLRKYRVQKRLETQKKKIKETSDDEPVKIVQLSIQQYQDIKKKNIKIQLVQLMKKGDNHSISVIRHLIDIFRLTFRYIIPSLMVEIIQQLKENLLNLLKSYPQLLPLPKNLQSSDPKINVIPYGSAHGIWADVLKQQWQDNIYFQNLKNIDNVQILQSLMAKDYFRWDWLVEHDFFKIKRGQFQIKFKNTRQKGIFYIFFSELFIHIKDQQILNQIIKLVQKSYKIPEHLIGKTKLYWQLHNFLKNNIEDYNQSFQNFLSLQQDEIYRIIFSKNKKNLVLKEIKAIYNLVCPLEVFDESILKYFKAKYSSLADLKYLLNRVNSQKQQFHKQNQNLYSVLLQSVLYKLKWTDTQCPPLSQVMVYYENIPLQQKQITKLNKIARIQKYLQLIHKILLAQKQKQAQKKYIKKRSVDMNLRKLFDNGLKILNKIAYYTVENEFPDELKFSQAQNQNENDQSFESLFNKLLEVRDNIYSTKDQNNDQENQINDEKILQILVSNSFEFQEYVLEVSDILKDERLLKRFTNLDFQNLLEKIIMQKVNKVFNGQEEQEEKQQEQQQKQQQLRKVSFIQIQQYINNLLSLLDVNSKVRQQLSSHLQLGILLSNLENPPLPPLIISIRFIENILQQEKTETVKKLKIDLIYQHMKTMGIKQPITNLYQVLIQKFLTEGQWNEAIKFTHLWNQQNDSICFSAMVMLRLSEELPRNLRPLMIDIIMIKFNNPGEILKLADSIISTQNSKDRRTIIENEIQKGQTHSDQNYQQNFFLRPEFKQLNYPQNSEWIKKSYDQIAKADSELQNDQIYFLYYRILMCNPLKSAQFFIKNYDFLNVKILKTLIVELSKRQFKKDKDPQSLIMKQQLFAFIYKCLLVAYSSNYLSKQFNLNSLIRLSIEQIDSKYSRVIQKLKTVMFSNYDQKDKFLVLRYFKRLSIKSKLDEKYSIYHFDLSDQQDNKSIGKHHSSNIELKSPGLKTKKSIYQMTPVEQNTNFLQFKSTNNVFLHTLKPSSMSRSLRGSLKAPSQTDFLDLPILQTANKSVYQRRQSQNSASPSYFKNQLQIDLLNSQSSKSVSQLQHSGNKLKESPYKITQQQQKEQKNNEIENQQIGNLQQQSIINKPQKQLEKQIKDDNKKQDDPSSTIIPEIDITKQKQNINDLFDKKRIVQSQDGSFQQGSLKQKPSFVDKQFFPENQDNKPNQKNEEQKSQKFRRQYDRNKQGSDFSVSGSIKISNENYATEKQMTLYDQSKYQNSQISSVYRMIDFKEEAIINNENEQKTGDIQMIRVCVKPHPSTIADIIKGDFALLYQQIKIHPNEQLSLIQQCVKQIFEILPFAQFVKIVERLRELSNKFHGAVKAQNFKVLKNACRQSVNFDLKSIFTPQILYIVSSDGNVDQTNKLIFRSLRPKIKAIVQQQNVFIIAKLIYISLHMNKSFEFRVHYYYVQKLFSEILQKQTQIEIQMDLEKIQTQLSRLPVSMTIDRIDKMLLPTIGNQKIQLIQRLYCTLLKALKDKKQTTEGEKYVETIETCQKDLNVRLQKILNK